MLAIIISLLIGTAIGGSIVGIIFYRYSRIKGANALIIAEQEAEKLSLRLQIEEAEQILIDEEKRIQELEKIIFNNKLEIDSLLLRRDTIQENIEIMEIQSEQYAQAFYNSCMKSAQEKLDKALEEVGVKYQSDEEAYRNAYLETVKDYVQAFEEISKEQNEKYQTAKLPQL